ncbi:MAG: hypothetical protein ACT4R6_14505 [Gemmatimonadaceae bacterium]
MRTAIVALAACLAAQPLAAQAQSRVQRPKEQAQRAVTATNAHTAAMTGEAAATTPSPTITAAPATAARPAASPNASSTGRRNASGPGAAKRVERTTFEREVFAYERSGRRDPFTSLMTTSELRPFLPDLRLVAVAYDATGRNSVAVLREDAQIAANATSVDAPQYRVREGQQLGRMRVARIGPKSVVFTIEEIGYSRQETLTLRESNTERNP